MNHDLHKHYGKYRGEVFNNIDPQSRGRLQVFVPAIYGQNSLNWALPCVPYAGPQEGVFMIPPIGANVWVEFEAGDIGYPIWAGCFWGDGECPGKTPQAKIIKTPVVTITLDELNPAAPIKIEFVAGDAITITGS